jgi:hypothetical protein
MALTIPNRFFPGTLTDADQVNADFDAVAAYANSSLETVATHNSDIALLPKGKVAYTQTTTVIGGITTVVDIVTATWTALASRYYKITGYATTTSTVAGDEIDVLLTDNTPTTIQLARQRIGGTGSLYLFHSPMIVIQPGAGSKTYRLRILRSSGTGTVTHTPVATDPAFILVEDIGL